MDLAITIFWTPTEVNGFGYTNIGAFCNSLNYVQSDNDARDKGADFRTPNLDSHSGKPKTPKIYIEKEDCDCMDLAKIMLPIHDDWTFFDFSWKIVPG